MGMTKEEAKAFLTDISYDLGTVGMEYLSVKDGEKMREAIETLEQEPMLDKIKENFIARYPRNYAGELELGGRSCVFSLNDILHTIDKESEKV